MGFLLGAYGKLMAGKRVRQLQARMMSVQSQLRRATRDIENMERSLNQQEKNLKYMNQSWMSNMMLGMSGGLQSSIFGALQKQFGNNLPMNGNSIDYSQLTSEQASYMSSITQQMTTQFQYQQQAMQSALMQQNSMIENNFETYKELQLQPLKDLEEDLQLEKDTLETQVQLAQQDYEACKEMEKAGSKNLTPQYTGQG